MLKICAVCRVKNYACLAFSTNLVRYIIVWQNPDVKLKDGTKSIPGRMRAGRSRAQIQPGKAEMWNGSGDGEAGRYSCACGCSVHSAAESAKDSVCFFTISGLATRLFATVRKTESCSVDIIIKG